MFTASTVLSWDKTSRLLGPHHMSLLWPIPPGPQQLQIRHVTLPSLLRKTVGRQPLKNVGKQKKKKENNYCLILKKKNNNSLCWVQPRRYTKSTAFCWRARQEGNQNIFIPPKHVKATLWKKKGVMTAIMSLPPLGIDSCVPHANSALHQQVGGTMSHNVEQNVKRKKKKLLLEIKLLTFTFLPHRKKKNEKLAWGTALAWWCF